MANTERFLQLLNSYVAGNMSEAEEAELLTLIRTRRYDDWLAGHIMEQMETEDPGGAVMSPHRAKLILNNILERHPKPKARLFDMRWKKWVAAASVIILIGLGAYFFINNQQKDVPPIAKTDDVTPPEKVKARITLADGRTFSIDSLTTLAQGDVNLVKLADGRIVYSGDASTSLSMTYNTLFNPRGSKVVNLTLSDGTRVWLNSESSLKYPIAFAGDTRTVEITGEAYFEVAKNSLKKFFVSGNGVNTEVLGTHFNVNTYADEASSKVTLLEGSIRINNSVVLKPGEQAQIAGSVHVAKGVDLDEVMAWKNGRFEFNNTSLATIMRQVQRWYNVEVVYQAGAQQETFSGGVPRTENVSEVLKMLELTNTVHFKIEGKKIIVMGRK